MGQVRRAKVTSECCVLKAPLQMRAQRDNNDIVGQCQQPHVARLVCRELHNTSAMECEIVGFRHQRTIGSCEQQRVLNQLVERGDIRLELS
jgi:hypothetical protein